MATSYGSLIVAFDDDHLSVVKAHNQVEFVGGVTLDPNGPKTGPDEDLRGERRPPAGEPPVDRLESTAAAVLDGPDAISAARFGAPSLARPVA